MKQNNTESLLPASTKTQGYIEKSDCTEVSIFKGEMTKKLVLSQFVRLKKLFPVLNDYFFNELKEAFINNGFTDERIEQSVNHVISTSRYKNPYIALFIDFDIRFKVYSFEQFREMIHKYGKGLYDKYTLVKLPNKEKGYYASNDDIKQYKLMLYKDYKKKKSYQN